MLVLHIGTHKTGTSSSQRFFAKNAFELAQLGVRYLETGRDGGLNHHLLGWAARDDIDYALWERVRGEISENSARIHLISSESFWFSDPAKVRSQIPQDQPITIVAYVRRQDKYLQSLYKQAVVGGRKMDFDTWLPKFKFRGDYLEVLNKWAECFGCENVSVRPYERNGKTIDITEDFSDYLGVGDVARAQEKKLRGNPSPRKELLNFIRAFNQLDLKVNRDRLFFPLVKRRPLYMRSADLMTYEQSSALLAEFNDANHILAEKYYSGEGPLFPDLTPAPPPEEWAMDDPEYMEMTTHVLKTIIDLAAAGEITKSEAGGGAQGKRARRLKAAAEPADETEN